MTLHTFGEGKRQEICSRLLKSSASADKYDTVILLPIPSAKDKIHVTGTLVPLCDIMKLKSGKTLIAGYAIPIEIAKNAVALGIDVADVACDEEFLRENAELTAHGTAKGEMLELLGLADTDKSVIVSVIKSERAGEALAALDEKFRTIKNGKGIAYTVPMTETIGVAIYQFLANLPK